jgi:hypothetical protein
MSKRIAIVGAGTAGLHLGLYLRQKGGQSTIFGDKKIEDYPNVRLLNTVAQHAVTVAREDDLGVNHWPDAGYFGHYYFIGMPGSPIEFNGDLTSGPSRGGLPHLSADADERLPRPRRAHRVPRDQRGGPHRTVRRMRPGGNRHRGRRIGDVVRP